MLGVERKDCYGLPQRQCRVATLADGAEALVRGDLALGTRLRKINCTTMDTSKVGKSRERPEIEEIRAKLSQASFAAHEERYHFFFLTTAIFPCRQMKTVLLAALVASASAFQTGFMPSTR